jgi:hypothetical protein
MLKRKWRGPVKNRSTEYWMSLDEILFRFGSAAFHAQKTRSTSSSGIGGQLPAPARAIIRSVSAMCGCISRIASFSFRAFSVSVHSVLPIVSRRSFGTTRRKRHDPDLSSHWRYFWLVPHHAFFALDVASDARTFVTLDVQADVQKNVRQIGGITKLLASCGVNGGGGVESGWGRHPNQ